ncbi:eag-like K[+] channel isoform X2 [Oratosquilla oratoria]|uniref:eag-like K[+] channel isoform X2 n=1 Tax=Oratosquilla oratoria TaxID=337810 RepID=UPI003F75810B
MPARRGLLAPQNTFLDTIATRFDGTHSNFVLGNAQVPSLYPIVYCSDGFCELTGYMRAQIMQKGCACKFLYGPETLEEHKMEIEKSLETKSELKIEVKFYKKNSMSFWCLLDIVPIKNEKREVVLFLASHKDITHSKMAELTFYNNYENDSDENENLDPEAPPANYGRRRSRAVLYQLSGHYKPDKMKNKLKINNNLLQAHATPLPEYKTASIKKSRFILTHYGMLKTVWDLVILLATFYVAVMVPYNAAFLMHKKQQDKPTIVPDVVVEALFFVDIILNFRTTFVNKKGEVVLSPCRIATHYVKGWFLLDLVAAMPFDLLLAADVYSSTTKIHMLKLTRLLRLARLMQKMERYSQYSALILTLLMFFFTLLAHWLACVWYAIAEDEMQLGPQGEIGWIYDLAERLHVSVDNVTTAERYVTALYFTCSSLTSVGFGNVSANTNREKIFSIVTMLIGALMHATVFGNVTSIIQRMYSRRSMYQTKWRDLKDFLTLNQIPKELKQRMQDYFQTMWSLNQGIDIHETLKEFPEELRGDISMHIHREILSLPIFETASQGCLKLLSLHIRNNFCAPGEYLVHRGDALQYIYYLCNGSMEVVMDDMVVAILGKGDLVGSDVDLPLRNCSDTIVKSSCDVKALTYCDLKSINIPGLVDVLRLYPEYQAEFANDIKHDLTYNLREGYDSEDLELGSGKNLLPSISEDDEERGSEDDDRSPVSTSPRSPLHARASNRFNFARVDDEGSPRWGYRGRDRACGVYRADRLKTLSPTRHHRSTDELRLDEQQQQQQARLTLEKLDSHFNTLHNDFATLSDEVRSVMNSLQHLQSSSKPVNIGSCITVGDEIAKRGKPDVVRITSNLGRSSSQPSEVFGKHDELPTSTKIAHNSKSNPRLTTLSPTHRRTCNVQTQTDLPIDVPVALLEAFVLTHRHRVLQLLGIKDTIVKSEDSLVTSIGPRIDSNSNGSSSSSTIENNSSTSDHNLTTINSSCSNLSTSVGNINILTKPARVQPQQSYQITTNPITTSLVLSSHTCIATTSSFSSPETNIISSQSADITPPITSKTVCAPESSVTLPDKSPSTAINMKEQNKIGNASPYSKHLQSSDSITEDSCTSKTIIKNKSYSCPTPESTPTRSSSNSIDTICYHKKGGSMGSLSDVSSEFHPVSSNTENNVSKPAYFAPHKTTSRTRSTDHCPEDLMCFSEVSDTIMIRSTSMPSTHTPKAVPLRSSITSQNLQQNKTTSISVTSNSFPYTTSCNQQLVYETRQTTSSTEASSFTAIAGSTNSDAIGPNDDVISPNTAPHNMTPSNSDVTLALRTEIPLVTDF